MVVGRKNKFQDVWKRINKKGEDDCWEWQGCKDKDGYGYMRINYRMYRVHRLVYKEIYKEIPKRLYVCHTCDNPKCCNPKHLYIGTPQDNMNDKVKKGRGFHPAGEKNGSVKLKREDILKIRLKYSIGNIFMKDLAEEYKVSVGHISAIILRKKWRNI